MMWFDLAAVGFFDAEISQPLIHFVILYIWRVRFLIGGGFNGFVQHPAEFAGSHDARAAGADARSELSVRGYHDETFFIPLGLDHLDDARVGVGARSRVKDSYAAIIRSVGELRVGRAVEDDIQPKLFRPGQSRQVMQKESPRAGFIAMPSDSPSDYIVAVDYIHS
jgi:hypothetical protein